MSQIDTSASDIQEIAYEAPTVTKIGSFEAMTQHAHGGGTLDADFHAGQPASSITFS